MKRLELYVVIADGKLVMRTTNPIEAARRAREVKGRWEKYSHAKQVAGARKRRLA